MFHEAGSMPLFLLRIHMPFMKNKSKKCTVFPAISTIIFPFILHS